MGIEPASEGGGSSQRRPLPDRGYLHGAGGIAGAEHHSRKISERRSERWVFCEIEKRVSLSLAQVLAAADGLQAVAIPETSPAELPAYPHFAACQSLL